MPLLGFGVYQNYNTRQSVLTALAVGYRYVIDLLRSAVSTTIAARSGLPALTDTSTPRRHTGTKLQSVKPSGKATFHEATCSSVRCVFVKVEFLAPTPHFRQCPKPRNVLAKRMVMKVPSRASTHRLQGLVSVGQSSVESRLRQLTRCFLLIVWDRKIMSTCF